MGRSSIKTTTAPLDLLSKFTDSAGKTYTQEAASALQAWITMTNSQPTDRGPYSLTCFYANAEGDASADDAEVSLGGGTVNYTANSPQRFFATFSNSDNDNAVVSPDDTAGAPTDIFVMNSLGHSQAGTASSDVAFSVSCWIKPTVNSGSGQNYIFGFPDDYTAFIDRNGDDADDNDISFQLWDGTNGKMIGQMAAAATTLNAWAHLVFTYDGSHTAAGLKIYVNGVLASSVAETAGSPGYVGMDSGGTSGFLSIGGAPASGSQEFDGDYSDFAIWKAHVLTADEVSALYSGWTSEAITRKTTKITSAATVSEIPKFQIRHRDHRLGEYPTIMRTGDPDYKGRDTSFYDDNKTLIYGSSFASGYVRFKEVPLSSATIRLVDHRGSSVYYRFQNYSEGLVTTNPTVGVVIIPIHDLDDLYSETNLDSNATEIQADTLEVAKQKRFTNNALQYVALKFAQAVNKSFNEGKIGIYADVNAVPPLLGKPGLVPSKKVGDTLGVISAESLADINSMFNKNQTGLPLDPGKVNLRMAIPGVLGNTGEAAVATRNQIHTDLPDVKIDENGFTLGISPWASGSFVGGNSHEYHAGIKLLSGSTWSYNSLLSPSQLPTLMHPSLSAIDVPEGASEAFHTGDNTISAFEDLDLNADKFYESPAINSENAEDLPLRINFKSPVRSKTMIEIPINPTQPTSVWFSTGSEKHTSAYSTRELGLAAGINSGLAYYNFSLNTWEIIGDLTTGSNVDIVNRRADVRTGSMLAFRQGPYGSIAIESAETTDEATNEMAKSAFSQNIKSTGIPTNYAGFPVSNKFDATGSQLLDMSNHISHPFLIEKVEIHWSGTVGTSPANLEDAPGVSSNQFFILNQYSTPIETTFSRQYLTIDGAATDQKTTGTIGTFTCNRYKDIVWYGRVSSYASKLITPKQFHVISASYSKAADLWLPAGRRNPRASGDTITGHHAPSGTFTLKSKTRVPSQGETLTSGHRGRTVLDTIRNSSQRDFFFLGSDGSRDLFGSPSGRSYYKGTPGVMGVGAVTSKKIFKNASDKKVNQIKPQNHMTSPYVLMPGDKLIIGFANQQIPHNAGNALQGLKTTTGFNQNHYPSPSGSEHHIYHNLRSRLDPGAGMIRLYGSLIRDGKEFHQTVNQNLTSYGIHEALHYDNPVVDQFMTEHRLVYSSSYLDDVIDGTTPHDPATPTTYDRKRVASAVTGAPVGPLTSGSLNRFRRFVDYGERYLDSMPGHPAEYHRIDGKKLLKISDIGTLILGSPNIVPGPSGLFASSLAVNTVWPRSFPFEPKYHQVERLRSISGFNKKFGFVSDIDQTATVVDGAGAEVKMEMTAMFAYARDAGFITDKNDFQALQIIGKMMRLWFGTGNPTKTTTARPSFGGTFENPGLGHRGEIPIITDSHVGGFFLFNGKIEVRGWKYGILNALPQHTSQVYRPDRFGQFRDMLEQRKYSRLFSETDGESSGDEPIFVRFRDRITGEELFEPADSNSQNLSTFATSSFPFFDEPRFIPNPDSTSSDSFIFNSGKMRGSLPPDMEPTDIFETSLTEAVADAIG